MGRQSNTTYNSSGQNRFTFYRVTYETKYPEVDLFRSLGGLPEHHMQMHWYRDDDGNQSVCADSVFSDINGWRKGYWTEFYRSITTKLVDWPYETEQRLVLSSSISDYEEIGHRKLRFSFRDLEGIIFGIKTSEEDKRAMFKIIKDKCLCENRTDFDFYQAHYSRDSGRIDVVKLMMPTAQHISKA